MLERCAQASLEWADNNAVRFEETKTEAIPFSNQRKHRRCRREIRVGSMHWVRFASEATRWLGIWLDASLNLEENRRRRIGKTHQAEAKLRRIVSQYGVPPGIGEESTGHDCPGDDALRFRADLERPE